jgi:hypothetical protein
MSSWLHHSRPIPKKPAIVNFGYRQLLPAGTTADKTKDVTVITAFYTMQGKYSIDVYKNYLRTFLEIPCKIVFYTEETMVPFIRQCRRAFEDTTDVVVIDRTKWSANKIPQLTWDQLTLGRPHSADYYKFLYEKREFVKRTMTSNPFRSTDFIWVNPTICKDSRIIPLIRGFPNANRVVTDKLMLINQVPFEFSDEKVKTIAGVSLIPVKEPRINSAIIAGTKEKWIQYSDLYEATIKKFQAANTFWGLDSIILTSIALEHKDMISLVEPKPIIDPLWKSMYGLLYFGSGPVLYSLLTDKAMYEKKMTLDELLAVLA